MLIYCVKYAAKSILLWNFVFDGGMSSSNFFGSLKMWIIEQQTYIVRNRIINVGCDMTKYNSVHLLSYWVIKERIMIPIDQNVSKNTSAAILTCPRVISETIQFTNLQIFNFRIFLSKILLTYDRSRTKSCSASNGCQSSEY